MKASQLLLGLVCCIHCCFGQQDLSKLFENSGDDHSPVYASFKATRIVNLKSNETVKKKNLDFIVSHRLGDAAGKYGGLGTFFGIDNAEDIRIALDYGLTDALTFGISRTKGATAIRQLYEANIKYKLVQQTADDHIPAGVTLYANYVISGMRSNVKTAVPDYFSGFSDRVSYIAEAIIVRKFSGYFTLALVPTYVHYNRVMNGDNNDTYAIGFGARLKVTKRFALIADYCKVLKKSNTIHYYESNGLQFYNPFGVGIEIETGGHVFQLTFMNSTAILENQFIPYTTTTWAKGQYRWGFNMSRTFSFVKSKGHKQSHSTAQPDEKQTGSNEIPVKDGITVENVVSPDQSPADSAKEPVVVNESAAAKAIPDPAPVVPAAVSRETSPEAGRTDSRGESTANKNPQAIYCIIVGSFKDFQNAIRLSGQLSEKGNAPVIIRKGPHIEMVSIAEVPGLSNAEILLQAVRASGYKDAWIYRKK